MTSKPASFFASRGHSSSKFSLSMKQERKPISKMNHIGRMEPTKNTAENGELPKYILHEVEHYKQRYNWDCGLSCVLMLLPEFQRKFFLDNFVQICQEEGFEASTWTIDLCYLLKRFDVKHQMFSTMIGVNEEFTRLSYYDNIMEKDRQRIEHRFEEAVSRGINIREGTLSDQMIRKHLVDHGPVIMLVDSGLLICDLCKHNKVKYEFRKVFGGTYCGHYILLLGFSRGKVLYRDPGLSKRICATSFTRLSEARTAPGTDQDLIFIYTNTR